MSKKRKLGEAPIDYGDRPERMSPDIEKNLRDRTHPLGAHKAFPGEEGDEQNFEEIIASKRFKDVIDKVKDATGLESVDPRGAMSLQPMMMQAVQKVMRIESQHKQELEELAVKLVVDQMSIPEGDLQFDAKLEKPTMAGMQQKPKKKKKEPKFDNPDVEDEELARRLERLNLEKQKRRLINSLIQGSSKKAHYMYHLIHDELNDIDPELVSLYSLIMSANDLMYWIIPDMPAMAGGDGAEQAMGGKEELDLETDPPTIRAKGVMFPILVHELWKGVMEYMSAHGLPSDPDFAEEVIGSEDTLPAEIWDLRLGPVIWEKFIDSYPEELVDDDDMGRIKNYLYFNVVSLEPEPFLDLAKEILSGSQKGKDMVAKIVSDIKEQLKKEDYEDISGVYDEPKDYPELEVAVGDEPQPEKEETVELDMDTILDKINKSGMASLTKDEKDFLYNL